MPFDGITINALVAELNNTILGGKVEKIYQPEKDELSLFIRKDKNSHKLLISANSTFPKFHLSTEKKSNPMTAPAFCMLLRKHLLGSRIRKITQISLERIVEILFDCMDEMGNSCHKSLIIETMGRHSNIIFINTEDSTVFDSIKRVNSYMSSIRVVLPGVKYVYPPSNDKIDTFSIKEDSFINDIENLNKSTKAYKYLVKRYYGISPIVSQEICMGSGIDPDHDIFVFDKDIALNLFKEFKKIVDKVLGKKYKPNIVLENQRNYDFSAIELNIYNSLKKVTFNSISEAVESFYAEKDKQNRLKQKTADLKKTVTNRIGRSIRKLDILEEEYNNAKKAEYFKLCGDLIMTNLYNIEKGKTDVNLINYFNKDFEILKVKLNINLTPIQNAQNYYKKYNKSKTAISLLTKQIRNTKKEVQYLEGVLDNIEKCYEEEEISEIKYELQQEGYFKKNNRNKKSKNKSKPSKPMRFRSSTGFNIYVGKNNIQNDNLTLKFAEATDLWLHTKDIPGSHVIIKTKSENIDETTLSEAANLAAYYSKGKLSSNVPVDYTLKKYVKKPSKARPGYVIYKNHKTIYINPDENLIKELSNRK